MQLDNTISAVVTGGASGLGAATARMLASHGVKVAIFDLNEELGEKLAKEIGGVFCKVNVASTEDVDAGFAKARAANGQERIMVNCAGVGGGTQQGNAGRCGRHGGREVTVGDALAPSAPRGCLPHPAAVPSSSLPLA